MLLTFFLPSYVHLCTPDLSINKSKQTGIHQFYPSIPNSFWFHTSMGNTPFHPTFVQCFLPSILSSFHTSSTFQLRISLKSVAAPKRKQLLQSMTTTPRCPRPQHNIVRVLHPLHQIGQHDSSHPTKPQFVSSQYSKHKLETV